MPLCVDLDGTLIRTDALVEGVLALATRPALAGALLGLRDGDRARFKRRIAAAAGLDPALLPYHQGLLAYLRQQRAAGRHLVLVTAADRAVADAVALHLGIFDEVMASDGVRNLKGRAKRLALVARFGERGFAYAGDSAADLHVWQSAAAAILVNASGATAAAARGMVPIEREFADRPPAALGLLRAMRPHQWVKNLLVFVPILAAGAALTPAALLAALIAFAAFCATASGIYLLNDLTDLAADRAHPRKRNRPFASGAVALTVGLAAGLLLVAVGAGLAWLGGILAVVALYAVLSISYSARLKEQPLVDVFMLAALYTIRLVGGGEATGHRVSLWLLAFSSFLFLGLALVKRVGELGAAAGKGDGQLARRGYQSADIPILQMFGCSASVAASLVLALFVQSEALTGRYATPALLWGVVPLVLFWQCRIWLSTTRGYMHDDPIVYAARDWVSWIVAGATALLALAARFITIAV